jgi:fucose permease
MLTAFALFGFIFMSTQYLQFILGYSALAAGVHTLPFAGAVMLFAPLSSRLVDRFGTKAVVATGLGLFAAGMLVAAGTTVDSTYNRVLAAILLMGTGMGISNAPATESIMGALPREKAGVGSAVNDTTRELGGALGVAIVGSVLSSLYGGRLVDGLGGRVPEPALDAAKGSVGAAAEVARSVGGDGGASVLATAQEAFIHAMTRASFVTAAFALAGALVTLRWLPARAHAPAQAPAEAHDPAAGSDAAPAEVAEVAA